MNIGFAVADFLTQVGLVVVGILVLDPELLVDQVDFGTTPTLGDFLIAIPVAMVAYTGIETISNMAEEARDVGKTIPAAMAGGARRGGDLRVPARDRAVRHARGRRRDAARSAEGGGRLRG